MFVVDYTAHYSLRMQLCCLAELCCTRKTVNCLAQTVDKLTLEY